MYEHISMVEITDVTRMIRDESRGKRWSLKEGDGPVIATAIHDGHTVREDVLQHMEICDADRLREEDPFTGIWAGAFPTQLIVHNSRFEVDVNRPRDIAIYKTPTQSWGLKVWKDQLPEELIAQTELYYDAFYLELTELIERKLEQHPYVFVFDIHSYCHQRQGPEMPFDPPEKNPEIDLVNETTNFDYNRFGNLWNRLHREIGRFDYFGRSLDVQANVRFQLAYLSTWLHKHFPNRVCAIQFEVKKFFMNEWTGQPYPEVIDKIKELFTTLIPAVEEELSIIPKD